ncbi:LPS export ABC transporter permease LptG [Celeribacter litoreus]|uniref:LPS export ABC transporter permease LptG n=1 Tax=Celeribacter litoreus TaxID=2876714 RepID=UPI001CCC1ED0|nr:LPS export ABC transporter permease LptG [Celeribacter litoreus]MCA0043703.1 LPS export ABC transporter permease LptG [Celeribacter litoreus]
MRLDLYFGGRFLRALFIVMAGFGGLTLLIESVEQIKRLDGTDAGGSGVLQMSLLRVPGTLYDLMPIIVMISTLVMFLNLARSSELVVARAAGRSAMRALVPPIAVAFLFGLLSVAVLNPFVAATKRSYEHRLTVLQQGERQAFSVSAEGLWLREGTDRGQMVIRASRSNFDGSELEDVTMLGFTTDGTPTYRIEAARARIESAQWVLTDAKRWQLIGAQNPEAAATFHERLTVPTSLTHDEIRDRFGDPEAIGIWDLVSYIEKLEYSGFSAQSYRMWLQSELALPLTFVAMVLIAAGFTMRHTRLGRTSVLVLTAVILAFGFYFLRSFAIVMGQNALLPIQLAAWAPPLAVIFGALALLLHLEDG